jgi:hypothetical protein
MSHFEVLTFTMCDGWVNCWSEYDEETATESPSIFATRIAATRALRDHLNEVRRAVLDGDMDEAYSLHNFKIVEVSE